jgi:hypothetical protein
VSGRQYIYAAQAAIILIAGGIFYIIRLNSGDTTEQAATGAAIEHAKDMQRQHRDILFLKG